MTERSARGSLLSVRGLKVTHRGGRGGNRRPILAGVDLDLAPGEALALVGPSGCGKSVTARALLGLLPPGFEWEGDVRWQGEPLNESTGAAWQRARGRGMGLIMQEPQASLNPVLSAGDQIAEALRVQRGLAAGEARRVAVDLLAETHVPDPARVARCYAHQLSGGMRQRVLLAAALACDPELLIADEPTTALDVSVQKEILALLHRICRDRNMALLFISHDLNLVSLLVERVAFMAAGRVTEVRPIAEVSFPDAPVWQPRAEVTTAPVLDVCALEVHHPRQPQAAVAGVDLALRPGLATGLLGESGCGKTSLGRALACHIASRAKSMTLNGDVYPAANAAERRRQRRQVQMLFQDPGGSLDPRQTVGAALAEAAAPQFCLPGKLLQEVGLDAELTDRYPHQMSGGQRQRVALARCLAASPSVLIADEPTSALDAVARDRILQLMRRIRDERGLALLIISHDVEVVQGICAVIHVMYRGLVVETLPGGADFRPWHPYTRELLAATPRTLRGDRRLWGDPAPVPTKPDPEHSAGCPRFGTCPLQKAICGKELPPLKMVAAGHWLRCPEAETNGSAHFIDTI